MRNIKQTIILASTLAVLSYPSLGYALCYDMEKEIPCGNAEFPHQAGDFPIPASSLTKQENGLIYDASTQRWWMQCSQVDCLTPQAMNWESAKAYCQGLTVQQKQWRLPTMLELNALLELHRPKIKINIDLFPDGQAGAYWTDNTSLTFKKNPQSNAWFVHFASGSIFDSPKTDQHLVRCISESQ
jgi:hypothetical protein